MTTLRTVHRLSVLQQKALPVNRPNLMPKVGQGPLSVGFSANAPQYYQGDNRITAGQWAKAMAWMGSMVGVLGGLFYYGLSPTARLWSEPVAWKTTLSPVETNRYQQALNDFLGNPNIQYRCFSPDKMSREFKEVPFNPLFERARHHTAERFVELLFQRPDLIERLQKQRFEITFYEGSHFILDERPTSGLAYHSGNLAFSTGSIETGLANGEDGWEPISHELAHRCDNMGNNINVLQSFDGLLPGWSEPEIRQFVEAREQEKKAIAANQSLLRDYALKDDTEFLAELASCYFEQPVALRASNPILYDFMNDFFKQNRAQLMAGNTSKPTGLLWELGASGLVLMTLVGAVVMRPQPDFW
jgi:hypothetical protein